MAEMCYPDNDLHLQSDLAFLVTVQVASCSFQLCQRFSLRLLGLKEDNYLSTKINVYKRDFSLLFLTNCLLNLIDANASIHDCIHDDDKNKNFVYLLALSHKRSFNKELSAPIIQSTYRER